MSSADSFHGDGTTRTRALLRLVYHLQPAELGALLRALGVPEQALPAGAAAQHPALARALDAEPLLLAAVALRDGPRLLVALLALLGHSAAQKYTPVRPQPQAAHGVLPVEDHAGLFLELHERLQVGALRRLPPAERAAGGLVAGCRVDAEPFRGPVLRGGDRVQREHVERVVGANFERRGGRCGGSEGREGHEDRGEEGAELHYAVVMCVDMYR
ncbi:hypothetical protein EDC01DRAFT_671007 [Geopyxis carbonaria]|nr:hypothetical protein EDC01DRAFT_671007 [Geopyxis carbonaria]